MMRLASSASLWCTARRTSPRSFTDSGNTECGTSDEIIDMMPCVSSSPRTICASMSECVRKMTTRSGNGFGDLFDLQENHRHVVVLRRIADKRRDLAQDALAQFVRAKMRVQFGELPEASLAKA